MSKKIQLLDCTLRDGAYIVDAKFGTPAIKGILKRMQDANLDIIECGWLKNSPHEEGTSFFHIPSDIEPYLPQKNNHSIYVSMIDWDRYDLKNLPPYDGKSIDAIRVVFPRNHFKEGVSLCDIIKKKGYKVYLQAANTLGYSDYELLELADEVNKAHPVCLSVVDTFGAMYKEDLCHIVSLLNKHLDKDIKLGFHSHNNQQLSFSLCMDFVEALQNTERGIILDSSLCGMGRGAGNATTELVSNYINLKHQGSYNIDIIMDAIDVYMGYFQENYSWGYSIPYFIAGMYCCHVNNIAYLLNNHRTNARDMRTIIESLSPQQRGSYDYDLLEEKYIENQSRLIDDEEATQHIKKSLAGRNILLIAPGKSSVTEYGRIHSYIKGKKPVIIGVNALVDKYVYDFCFITNSARYNYAKEAYPEQFINTPRIVTSNIKVDADKNEWIINFNYIIKRGWEHFDNAVICCLRLLDKLQIQSVAIAGFDGFKKKYNESYADESLPSLNTSGNWDSLNVEIKDMFNKFKESAAHCKQIDLITESIFD